MQITIEADAQTFEFQPAFDMPRPMVFSTSEEALIWLRRVAGQDSNSISKLRKYLTLDSTGIAEISRLTDDAALARLAVLLHARRIVVLRKFRTAGGGAPTPKVQELAPAFPLSERRRHDGKSNWKESKTWISIELKDTDGNAMAGEDYRIDLPDGRVVTGKLNRMGTAAVNGIDPGQCKVSFPRLSSPTWALSGTKH